ncbi:MAG: MFS transporter [Bifidobacterium tibiigranuli]|jgi:EmrB/QacA subfamily drug resistance transporter|nr:MFS transporter [Bifidobacterium tibiigranuli]
MSTYLDRSHTKGARPSPRAVLAVVCISTFMLLLDTTVVNLALADLQSSLHASLGQLQWVVDAYLLTLGTFLLLAGAAGDRYGQTRLFRAGLVVFTLGSLACSLAPSVGMLIAARAVQGIGGALLLGIGLPMLRRTFTGAELNRAVGLFGASIGLATAIGPLVGGGLTDMFGWRAIFVINVPIGIACLILALIRLAGSRAGVKAPLDIPGAILLGLSLAALIFGLIEANMERWDSPQVLASLIVSAGGFAALIVIEPRRSAPLIPRQLIRQPQFIGASVTAFVSNGLLVGASAIVALYFQNVLGESPMAAGLRFLSLSLAAFLAGILGGRKPFASIPLTAQMIASLAATSAGIGCLLLAGPDMAPLVTIPAFALAGLGMGIGSVSLSRIALDAAEPDQAGVSAGVVNTMRQIGASVGVAAFGTIFAHAATARLTALFVHTPIPAGLDATNLTAAVASGAGTQPLRDFPSHMVALLEPLLTAASRYGMNVVLGTAAAVGFLVAVVITIDHVIRRRSRRAE